VKPYDAGGQDLMQPPQHTQNAVRSCAQSVLEVDGVAAARRLGQDPQLLLDWLDSQLAVLDACTLIAVVPERVMELWQCFKVCYFVLQPS
jgi:hypothetical protein